MCNICKDVEIGGCELLVWDTIDIAVGSKVVSENYLGFYIGRDADGNYRLVGSHGLTELDVANEVNMPITHCPFCGEELQHA